jgi:hypothetical protein
VSSPQPRHYTDWRLLGQRRYVYWPLRFEKLRFTTAKCFDLAMYITCRQVKTNLLESPDCASLCAIYPDWNVQNYSRE